jgi:hypothetical protein
MYKKLQRYNTPLPIKVSNVREKLRCPQRDTINTKPKEKQTLENPRENKIISFGLIT